MVDLKRVMEVLRGLIMLNKWRFEIVREPANFFVALVVLKR